MKLSPSEVDELRHLLADILYGDEPLTPQQEHRFRQLLARENDRAFGMGWDELVKFGKLVHGLWLVQQAARERRVASGP